MSQRCQVLSSATLHSTSPTALFSHSNVLKSQPKNKKTRTTFAEGNAGTLFANFKETNLVV